MGLWVEERRGGTGKVRVVHGAGTTTDGEPHATRNLAPEGFSSSEMMLIAEAVRRAMTGRGDGRRLSEAVLAEARRGTRTTFGRVKAGAGVGCVQ